jgi:hypothetical protein
MADENTNQTAQDAKNAPAEVPDVPSWYGKKVEDMTPDEKAAYDKSVADRFTWQPGDLVYLGNEPLTDDEKKFVEEIKKMEAQDKEAGNK